MNFVVKKYSELTKNELYEILRVRSQIFVVELKMNCQDIDKIDFDARHYFFEKEGNVFAYLRAFYTDSNTVRIGRVLTVKHGNGWGRKIMELAIDDIKVNMPCKTICLDSQKHAVEFYEKVGFKVVSDKFIEEGVPHVKMELEK